MRFQLYRQSTRFLVLQHVPKCNRTSRSEESLESRRWVICTRAVRSTYILYCLEGPVVVQINSIARYGLLQYMLKWRVKGGEFRYKNQCTAREHSADFGCQANSRPSDTSFGLQSVYVDRYRVTIFRLVIYEEDTPSSLRSIPSATVRDTRAHPYVGDEPGCHFWDCNRMD